MNFPDRKPTRLKGYNYSTPGSYFITICTHNRKCVFSEIVGYLKMNASKKIHNSYSGQIWQRSYHDHIIRNEKII